MQGYLELHELADLLGTTAERATSLIRKNGPIGTIYVPARWLVPEESVPELRRVWETQEG